MSSVEPVDVSELFHSKEEEIVNALSSTDLQSLSKELSENVVITRQANVMFNSLDHDRLNPRTRARYLLSLVIDNLLQGHHTYSQFHKVLSRRTGACMQLVRWLDQQRVPSNTGEGYLHESDIEFLVDYLVSCSYKWEELGAMLGLPTYVLENCRIESSMELRLRRLLTEWVTGSFKCAKNCTLKTLKASLQSSVVAFENLSCGLQEAYKAHIQSQMGTAITTDPCPIITFKSSDTEVADHKSALLEVQVKKTSEPVSYQWMRDGQPLTDSSHFSGTTTAILLIDQASLGAEGKYSCHVRCDQKQYVVTEPAVFGVLYPPEKKTLISRYNKTREIPGSSWPPGTCNIYVELMMIKKSKVKKPSHLVIEEEIEALLVNQEIISFNSVFDEYLSGAIILVEGRPGSGKTTLANKIVKDWSQGKALKNADKVFLIPLRRDLSRSQIFKLFYHSQYYKYMEDIEESGGDKVCFVLDGYDEFSPQDKYNSVFEDILSKKYLPESMVIVTSRSEAALSLRQKTKINIELLGFTKEHFEHYIENYPFEMSTESNEELEFRMRLQKYVKGCTNVTNICYLPINASIICFLFSQHLGDKPPPKTESKIYEALIVAIVLRKVRSKYPSAQLHSLKDLTGENKTIFEEICLLAFHMTKTNTQISPKTLHILKNSPFRELFAPDSVFELYGVEEVFSFIHLTLQEYLAAYHLASLSGDKQTEVIKTYAERAHHMITTFKFYCGIIDYKTNKTQYQELFSRIPVSYNMLYLAHCVYESQQPELCRTAVNLLNREIDLKFTTLTPADFTALDYLISAVPQMITHLDITTCQLYEECITDLLEMKSIDINKLFKIGTDLASGFSDKNSLMKFRPFMNISYKMNALLYKVISIINERAPYDVYYHHTKLDHEEYTNNRKTAVLAKLKTEYFDSSYVEDFAHSLLKCKNLKIIILSESPSISNTCIRAGLLNNTPRLLKLSIREVAGEAMIKLGKGLQHCKELIRLDIRDSHCVQEGSTALADGLQHCKFLRSFTLYYTNLGSEGAIKLASVLKTMPLNTVCFMACDIDHDSMVALATEGCFSHTRNILCVEESSKSETMSIIIRNMAHSICALFLKGNDIHSRDITTLVKKINSYSLERLDLNFSPIGSEGAAALGTGLYNCSNLMKLTLSGCNITTDGIPALVSGFRYWNKLTHLDLCDNQLCTKAMTALSNHLYMVPSLYELCVAHNMIDYKGARALARGLRNCRVLEVFHINNNIIGSVGAAAISNALKHFSMKFVNFSNNSIDLENELLAINLINLAKHGGLVLLDLSHNEVGPDNTLRLVICLMFHLLVLNIATMNVVPELIEFVTAFKKIWTFSLKKMWTFPKIHIYIP